MAEPVERVGLPVQKGDYAELVDPYVGKTMTKVSRLKWRISQVHAGYIPFESLRHRESCRYHYLDSWDSSGILLHPRPLSHRYQNRAVVPMVLSPERRALTQAERVYLVWQIRADRFDKCGSLHNLLFHHRHCPVT